MSDTLPAQSEPLSAEANQSVFPRERQAEFLAVLAEWGNVRAAARRVGVSRATVYRMRRLCPTFQNLWDAALLHARPQVEEVLADRALNGVEETVFYHGEEVAVRRRYDARLLLAHLARLDRLGRQRAVVDTAYGFEHSLVRLARSQERREIPYDIDD